jgi:glycerophosphoryl diester phosphodiesterase
MAKDQTFLTIGHRGAAGEKFENSMSGFEHALSLDIDAIELDIRKHNGELWVIHDHELERLTGKPGLFDDLNDPGSIHLKNDEPIPRLHEVLDLCWGKMPLNIEIKSFDTATLLAELLAEYPLLEENPAFPWVLISSFDHRQILQLKNQGCSWALAPITHGVPMQPDAIIAELQPYSWHMDDEYLDLPLIEKIQDQGTKVMVYTVNDFEFARKLKQAGIDGIFTDLPSTLRDID